MCHPIKRLATLFTLTLTLLLGVASCGSTVSLSGGLNDEAYLVVASSSVYQGHKVYVSIDEESVVGIVAIRPDQVTPKAKRITITPGRHLIRVHDAETRKLFEKEIFVSTRSTKTITLR